MKKLQSKSINSLKSDDVKSQNGFKNIGTFGIDRVKLFFDFKLITKTWKIRGKKNYSYRGSSEKKDYGVQIRLWQDGMKLECNVDRFRGKGNSLKKAFLNIQAYLSSRHNIHITIFDAKINYIELMQDSELEYPFLDYRGIFKSLHFKRTHETGEYETTVYHGNKQLRYVIYDKAKQSKISVPYVKLPDNLVRLEFRYTKPNSIRTNLKIKTVDDFLSRNKLIERKFYKTIYESLQGNEYLFLYERIPIANVKEFARNINKFTKFGTAESVILAMSLSAIHIDEEAVLTLTKELDGGKRNNHGEKKIRELFNIFRVHTKNGKNVKIPSMELLNRLIYRTIPSSFRSKSLAIQEDVDESIKRANIQVQREHLLNSKQPEK